MFLSERRLGAFTNEVRTEVDHDGPLAPEPEVILMEIVRHTRPTLTVPAFSFCSNASATLAARSRLRRVPFAMSVA